MIKTWAAILASAVLALTSMLAIVTQQKATTTYGSVTVGNDYFSTTTSNTSNMPVINVLTQNTSPRQGTFGSIIQTAAGAAGGSIDIYDATTTNVSLRTGQLATSSILIASIPTNATVGTYTYDSIYKHGILIVTSGTVGTTTITWR